MLRFLTLGAILTVMVSAVLLYVTATETRRLVQLEKTQKKKKAELIRDISVLKAERAYLSRPERIAKFAKQLGMQPVSGEQLLVPRDATKPSRR
ncbi:MAG: cell division protein FtsL [Pseudomonadota bacterium]